MAKHIIDWMDYPESNEEIYALQRYETVVNSYDLDHLENSISYYETRLKHYSHQTLDPLEMLLDIKQIVRQLRRIEDDRS